MKIRVKRMFGSQCVLSMFAKSCPKRIDRTRPNSMYMSTIETA